VEQGLMAAHIWEADRPMRTAYTAKMASSCLHEFFSEAAMLSGRAYQHAHAFG